MVRPLQLRIYDSADMQPFRHPIVSVGTSHTATKTSYIVADQAVGRPIHVRQETKPSDEHVQELQQLYIEELMRYVVKFRSLCRQQTLTSRIWNRYKDVYAQNRTKELTLIE